MVTFADPWNPTGTEVREWAYSEGELEPCQDWHLALLSWEGRECDYLEFAADSICPHQRYFLHVIYLMVGDTVRSGFRWVPETTARGFVELAENHRNKSLRLWRERALELLENPSKFKYTDWCDWGYAKEQA